MPSYRVAQLVQAALPGQRSNARATHQLESAGAGANLIRNIERQQSAASPATQIPRLCSGGRRKPPAAIITKASSISAKPCAAIRRTPPCTSRWLRCSASKTNGNDAFDEITQSDRLMPDLPENHSAFAYIFLPPR